MIKNRHNGNWCCFFGRWRKLFNLFSGKISLTKPVSKEAANVCITKKEKKIQLTSDVMWCHDANQNAVLGLSATPTDLAVAVPYPYTSQGV